MGLAGMRGRAARQGGVLKRCPPTWPCGPLLPVAYRVACCANDATPAPAAHNAPSHPAHCLGVGSATSWLDGGSQLVLHNQ